MPKRALAQELAEALVRSVSGQRQAGKVLHDDVGPLLSAAGLRLQIVRMDFPDAAEAVREAMEALDDAMDRVRDLSQQLNPSLVDRMGFQQAMESMIEAHQRNFAGKLDLRFAATARLPSDAAVAMYDAAETAVAGAVAYSRASQVIVSVTGSNKSAKITVKIKDNGRHRSDRTLAMASEIARAAGLKFEVFTGKGTIVGIHYAFRRPTGG
jgi:two-component system, NarL family, sensor kinase